MSNSSERSKPLGFDLRDRIAAALYKAGDNRISPGMCRQQADAVIRELGLRQEQRDLMDGECGQSINYVTGKVTNHYRAATRQFRYVTEWIADE